ncbi:MAG: acetyl-CoA carboxylase biotin carboxyl carrier protein [Gammaproteobacteria bacterium]|nr:MAG: acetyl-CoA carboxylase biotin carboxyl carrier protein [Gammaproteobacteria bacterium]
MDIRKVKKLIELLQESGISEIEVHEGEESVRITNHHMSSAPQTVVQVPQAPVMIPQASAQENVDPALMQNAPETPLPAADEGHIIKSPMVGIFYSSPSPDTPGFVEIGQTVEKGDILCIIEAMKIMNQIEADVTGVVSKVYVENGEPIEYGQPLFAIK